jgi:hypothetical protein
MTRHVVAVVALLTLSPVWVHAQSPRFTVSTASASVHRSPSTGSPVIGTAPRGSAFDVTRELGSWVRIPWPAAEDGSGYLRVTWGTIDRGPAPSPNRATTPASEPAAPVAASASASVEQPISVRPVAITTTTSLPSHVIGLGGRMSSSAFGFAVTARAWSRGPLGLQVEVGRSTLASSLAPEQMTSMQFAPSLVYALPDAVSNAVWLRPYVGAGANVYRSSLSTTAPATEPSSSQTDFGFQSFGGGEVTFAAAPWFAISAEAGYNWTEAPFPGFELGGPTFSVSGHWYVK